MNKKYTILIFSLLMNLPIFSQADLTIAKTSPLVLVEKTNDTQNNILENVNKNILPLFGEIEKTPLEKQSDQKFIGMCTKNFPTLNDASKFFADRGWEYISESELDTATYRFNLCYLLNPTNVDAYWGLGVIQYQKGNLDLATNILKKGLLVDSTNSSLIVDLATVEVTCFEKNNHSEDLTSAHKHLAQAIEIDPTNVSAWLKRAETEYFLENYENSWDCIHSARLLDITKIDLIFTGKLALKMIDPKGIFKF